MFRSNGFNLLQDGHKSDLCPSQLKLFRLARWRAARDGKTTRSVRSILNRGDQAGWICGICKKPIPHPIREFHNLTPDNEPTWDHIIPLSRGGSNRNHNLQLAHFKCNSVKGNREPGSLPLRSEDRGTTTTMVNENLTIIKGKL